MNSKNYYVVVKNLQNFASHHLEIKRFKSSYVSNIESFSGADISFPILYITPLNVQNHTSTNDFTFRTYCLDRLNSDASNELDIHNTTQLIIQDLCVWLRQSDNGFFLDNDPIMEPAETFLMDGLAGWYVDITLSSATYMYDCVVPFNEEWFNGTSGVNCDYLLPGPIAGTSGTSGINGTSGTSGSSGTSGIDGSVGSNGTSGTSGTTGTSGTSGYINYFVQDPTPIGINNGDRWYDLSTGLEFVWVDLGSGPVWMMLSGEAGENGTSGTSGFSGTSGANGTSGSSGTSGSNGTSGTSGFSGTSGANGTSGSSGTSGSNGTSGTSGSNGTSGTSGSSGTSGTSGSNGTSGTSGSNGTSGINGSIGSNGTSGTSGVNGLGFSSLAGTTGQVAFFTSTSGLAGTTGLTWDGTKISITGSIYSSGQATGGVQVLTVASNATTLNCSLSNFFTITLGSSSTTTFTISNIPSIAQTIIVQVTTGTSSLVSFPSTVKQPSGSTYIPTITSGSIDILSFVTLGNGNLYLVNSKNLQ